MCWRGTKRDRRVADKDIETYKVMYKYENKYVPYYYYIIKAYKVGETYKETLEEISIYDSKYLPWIHNEKDAIKIENGFHSYSSENTDIAHRKMYNTEGFAMLTKDNSLLDYYGEGYLTNDNEPIKVGWSKDPVNLEDKLYVVKCIIPKGSTYYENDKGEIVSDTIIITGDEIPRDAFANVLSEENNV